MTDQTPSTEAGRNAFIDLQRDPPPQSRQYWDATIFAIEEQARAEGRQQTVTNDCPLCKRDVAYFLEQQQQLHDHRHLRDD